MKRVLVFSIIAVMVLTLYGCSAYEIEYTDNNPLQIEMKGDSLKILQVTDLHLSYGIDDYDNQTLKLIGDLAKADDYDLIVITGDMMMSPIAPALFTKLIRYMESLEIPWTFIFGNHEMDFNDYADFIQRIKDTEYLYFKVGPELTNGVYGNFKIEFTKNNQVFYNAYFLDSKAEREIYTEEQGEYDYLSTAQVEWYEDLVQTDTVDSIVFMHIPLRQFIDSEGYVGIFNEDKVYAQGIDTGFFDAMVTYGKSKGVFVGHDHKNDFFIIRENIMLAYGRATGYNAYGNLELGGRHIEISALGVLSSRIVLESEVH
ncbi:MAG: metallophosphoesterase [Firmicutes bacterium]|nr:metallophosphoesterase [Bacillota bacterium]